MKPANVQTQCFFIIGAANNRSVRERMRLGSRAAIDRADTGVRDQRIVVKVS